MRTRQTIMLLELFDRGGVTRRVGDDRVPGRSWPTPAHISSNHHGNFRLCRRASASRARDPTALAP
ncbi:SelB C-terminal domain-containing protein [Sorangium sp. So ce1128]|uniref:Elongation factor SelB fourth winged-helix domain-containing protein n=1 Tax=Sorangium cellulosum TaxID=56 RepID=A0A3S7V032_SORCE|nr:hypothetical protein [Sorangium cellulosum]